MAAAQNGEHNIRHWVSVRPSGNGNYNLSRVNSNFITSVYGRENFDRHLELELQADNILYINKQKKSRTVQCAATTILAGLKQS